MVITQFPSSIGERRITTIGTMPNITKFNIISRQIALGLAPCDGGDGVELTSGAIHSIDAEF